MNLHAFAAGRAGHSRRTIELVQHRALVRDSRKVHSVVRDNRNKRLCTEAQQPLATRSPPCERSRASVRGCFVPSSLRCYLPARFLLSGCCPQFTRHLRHRSFRLSSTQFYNSPCLVMRPTPATEITHRVGIMPMVCSRLQQSRRGMGSN